VRKKGLRNAEKSLNFVIPLFLRSHFSSQLRLQVFCFFFLFKYYIVILIFTINLHLKWRFTLLRFEGRKITLVEFPLQFLINCSNVSDSPLLYACKYTQHESRDEHVSSVLSRRCYTKCLKEPFF
jgi:hypothetical protein